MDFLLPLLLFCLSSIITPGPNNIMLMTSGLNFGIKQSLPHYLGICLGFPAMVLAVGLGLGVVFTEFPIIHPIIKIIGAIYMLYLAWKIASSHTNLEKSKSAKPMTFLQAVLFQWVNPKAWVMSIGAVAAYTIGTSNFTHEILLISSIFLLLGLPCIGAWLFFGAGLKYFLTKEKHQRYFNYTMSALLVISIALIFIE